MSRPAIRSSCTVRPSAIRSLVLPHRVFPQNSSSSAHTSSRTKASHQDRELTLLSINLVCGVHKEQGDEMFEYTDVIVCQLCWLKEVWAARHDSGTFGDELQWVAEYSEAWLPPFGSIIYKLMAKTVSAFPTPHLEMHIQISYKWKLTLGYNQCIDLFALGLTLKAPGLSLCLDTLSSWMVSVKVGHGEECSYLQWLEKSSWSHLEQT